MLTTQDFVSFLILWNLYPFSLINYNTFSLHFSSTSFFNVNSTWNLSDHSVKGPPLLLFLQGSCHFFAVFEPSYGRRPHLYPTTFCMTFPILSSTFFWVYLSTCKMMVEFRLISFRSVPPTLFLPLGVWWREIPY